LLSENDIKVGRLVLHHQWGIGELQQTDPSAGHLVINFAGRPGHQMSRDLAFRVLSPVDGDGLRAISWKSPELVTGWVKSAPLKLVVAAFSALKACKCSA